MLIFGGVSRQTHGEVNGFENHRSSKLDLFQGDCFFFVPRVQYSFFEDKRSLLRCFQIDLQIRIIIEYHQIIYICFALRFMIYSQSLTLRPGKSHDGTGRRKKLSFWSQVFFQGLLLLNFRFKSIILTSYDTKRLKMSQLFQ